MRLWKQELRQNLGFDQRNESVHPGGYLPCINGSQDEANRPSRSISICAGSVSLSRQNLDMLKEPNWLDDTWINITLWYLVKIYGFDRRGISTTFTVALRESKSSPPIFSTKHCHSTLSRNPLIVRSSHKLPLYPVLGLLPLNHPEYTPP